MKKALIVIDLIEDIIGENGASHEQVIVRDIIAKTNQAVKLARANSMPIIWVKVGFQDDYQDMPPYSPMFNVAKSKGILKLSGTGCEWEKDLDRRLEDIEIVKKGVSAFAGNNLHEILQKESIAHLMICGVSSTMTIESTTRLAHDLGYKITILEDACAANTQNLHEQSMLTLQAMADICKIRQLQD